MVQDGIPFAQALKGAQANGYAEQNPAADVEGQDTCRKLCILSSIAFGWHLLPEQVPTTGITSITLADEAYADACQRRIKLLGRAIAREDGTVCAYVEPHFISLQNPLAGVDDVFNAILVKGDATGDVCSMDGERENFPPPAPWWPTSLPLPVSWSEPATGLGSPTARPAWSLLTSWPASGMSDWRRAPVLESV
ncbi:MAG: hypothetical protein ACLS43_07345 [Evtepia gabavorous]